MSHYFDYDPNLKSEEREISYNLFDRDFTLISDNGVFSKNSIDQGTMVLLKTVCPLIKENEYILDLGCAYGAVGLSIASLINSARVLCVDVNERAVKLCAKNANRLHVDSKVETRISDVYSNVSEKFSSILLNPPIRAGKKVNYQMYSGAREHLLKDGSLYIVIRKAQGALSALEYLESIFLNAKVLEKKKGYWVIRCSDSQI